MEVGMINQLNDLVIARRLMIQSQEMLARSKGKDVKLTSAKEAMEEDQLLLSGEVPAGQTLADAKSGPPAQETQINLAELGQKLADIQNHPETGLAQQPQADRNQFLMAYQRTETELTIRYKSLEQIDGLVLKNDKLAVTDRYQFDFTDGATFKITDKWTGKSTTIWGDPHVDTSDQEGDRNGEFSDLKTSDTHTTLMLEDSTRVTFTARDNGIIEQVDIFKGQQHLTGIGAESKLWGEGNQLFSTKVDTQADSFRSSIPLGDTLFAGGDGADWYDSSGRLIWGKTTGAGASTRPSDVIEIEYKQATTSQVVFSSQEMIQP